VDYQFDEEYFAEISDEAKDFIRKLLVKNPRYVVRLNGSTIERQLLHNCGIMAEKMYSDDGTMLPFVIASGEASPTIWSCYTNFKFIPLEIVFTVYEHGYLHSKTSPLVSACALPSATVVLQSAVV
jgi:hypothetical protein